ncbi:DUF3037 domain-containing protein [Mucilaginibacter sp. L196]|uniref:DUF3037 domain-containing protein n=1 Tax=Mucilaginibacter sp. L196 TaxID=1641870 RepID=UPI00131A9843|nr:DUF3037 domain-containing protein [Mucilaginibacter sp. L196]
MHNRTLFEYAVIRVMPRVEREEFLNIGIILYCAKQKYLKMLYILDVQRLQAFSDYLDMDELKEHMCSFERICSADAHGGPIAKLDMPSRFRWLTATRSTVLQTSKVHPGLCVDAEETTNRLFSQLVL